MERKLMFALVALVTLAGCKEKAQDIQSAGNFNCAVHSGSVSCWGSYTVENEEGGFDTVDVSSRHDGYADPKMAVGVGHYCILDEGQVECFLDNSFGQTEVPDLVAPTHIAAGPKFTCVTDQSELKCWGDNDSLDVFPLPRELVNPRDLVAGVSHVCVLDDLGVACKGFTIFDGGDPNPSFPIMPTQITSSPSSLSTCGYDDQWYCWGGTATDNPDGFGDFDIVIPGREQACGLSNGQVECWGESAFYTDTVNDSSTNPTALAIGLINLCVIANEGVVCDGNAGPVPDYL